MSSYARQTQTSITAREVANSALSVSGSMANGAKKKAVEEMLQSSTTSLLRSKN
jgi:hypothetical protein